MQALAGIRILDFTQVLAGPFATQQLAQLGAEIIKVEPVGKGDMTRAGLLRNERGRTVPSFTTCNIGKKSIALDLKQPAACEVVQRLLPSCDVMVENMKPGVMQRLGFGYDTVRALRPDIIYCSVSGYGQTGPGAERPAFDGAIQADSGMMSISGHPQTGPVRTGYFAVDMTTGLNTAFAITAALLRRQRTGDGQRVDVAMEDTAMMLMAPQMSAYLANGTLPELLGNASPTRQPTADVFPTADGHIQIAALSERHVKGLFDLTGLDALDAQFPDTASRIHHREHILARLYDALRVRTTAEWIGLLETAGIPCARVRTLDQVAVDPQLATRPAIVEAPVANDGSEGTVKVVGASHTTFTDPPKVQRAAPALGEHTDELLHELGYDKDAIRALRDTGAVG
ncbi:MAG: CoA transferase [Pseudomonadales bacterium]|nr:CoA transferase [Pseudomonadales bacterium]